MKEDAKKKAAAEGNPEFVAQVGDKIKKEKDKDCAQTQEQAKKAKKEEDKK
jgi:hypothetical protein